jgi:predicted phosphodiesterase
MPTRIAILADIHLSDIAHTAREAALDWALKRLRVEAPDVLLVAGDVTASGTSRAARRFREKMDRGGLPFLITLGDSDCRNPKDSEHVRDLLATPRIFMDNECVALVLDSSDGCLSICERQAVELLLGMAEDRSVVLVSHLCPDALKEDSRAWMKALLQSGAVSLFIAGHHHADKEATMGNAAIHSVRCLDPDKAIGACAAIAVFELHHARWSRRDIPFPGGDVGRWPPDAREEFLSCLGISCMSDTLGGLAQARGRRVSAVELRAGDALSVPTKSLETSVRQWREDGGKYLSVHMPDLQWDETLEEIRSIEAWRAALALAVSLDAQALTLHVPRAPVGHMQPGDKPWEALAEVYCKTLRPAIDKGTVLSIENLHMGPAEMADESRGFGYLPHECLGWIRSLRKKSSYDRIGLHLDIGHARNNPPYSKRLGLSQWYALTGAETTGYHLHQVVMADGEMENHRPLLGVFGPLISLGSFFWAWHNGQLRHAPLFLEVRDSRLGWASLDHLRKHFACQVHA